MGKRPMNPNRDMELEAIKTDIKAIRNDMALLKDIKVMLIGNADLGTTGIVQDFGKAKSIITELSDTVEEFTGRVEHIFEWREKYLAGKKEYRAWKTERFRWTFQNIWSVISTVLALILGLKELGVI